MASRRRGAIPSIIFGLILLVILTVVLFNNEGRSIKRIRALENVDNAIEISSTDTSIADGTMIIFSDDTKTDEVLTDDVYGVIAPDNALKLLRQAYMYQWVEEDNNGEDESGNYDYYKEWVGYLVDSEHFYYTDGHENPESFNYKNMQTDAENVTMGSYTLSYAFSNQFNSFIPYENMTLETRLDTNMSQFGNTIYISDSGEINIDNPQIGDVKIEFTYVPSQMTTVLGEKSGEYLVAYNTKNGDLAEVEYGTMTKESLKAKKLQDNKQTTWAIRIGCIIGLMIGIALLFSPLTNLLGRIPIIGNIINGGFFLIGSVLGISWGIIVIAVGWLFYRPVVAVLLIIAVIALTVFISNARKDKAPRNQNNYNYNSVEP